jgi:HAD superfamily hydrolase (TIGR01549 family)
MTRAVLFDLDDTLFDHRSSSRAALARVHDVFAPSASFDAFERHHTRYLEEMHVEVLAGRIGMDEARCERFRRVFRALGLDLSEDDTWRAAGAYRSGYLESRRPMDGAAALLQAVRTRARIGIVSNNLLEEQREKLEFCGLAPFVDALVVSEEAGISKPDPEIFRIALRRLDVSADQAVMVGDSWAADIVGARAAGIRANWYNPPGARQPAGPLIVTEIAALTPVERVMPLLLDED